VFAIVEHEQEVARADPRDKRLDEWLTRALAETDRRQNALRYERRVRQRRQLDKPHPIAELVQQTGGQAKCKVSLPAPACTSHGQQPSVGLQQFCPREGKVVLAADQVHAMRGQIVAHRATADCSVRGRRAVRAPCVLDVKQRRATRRRETGLAVLLTGDPRLVGADRRGGCMHRVERGVNDFSVVRLHCFAERDGVGALQA
jgi:hypothetical protein